MRMPKIILRSASAQVPGNGQTSWTGFYPIAISIINTFVMNNDTRRSSGSLRQTSGLLLSIFDSFRQLEFAPMKFKRGVPVGQQIGNAVRARVEMKFVG